MQQQEDFFSGGVVCAEKARAVDLACGMLPIMIMLTSSVIFTPIGMLGER